MLLQAGEVDYRETELYIDVTENRLYEVMVEGKDSEEQKKQHSGMEKQENPERENGADPQEWLEEHLYRYISHDRHREWTRKLLARENLEKRYRDGRHLLRIQCHLVVAERLIIVEVMVYLFQRTLETPLEAHIFIRDETRHYMDDMMNTIIYQKEYKTMGIVNLDHAMINFRSCHFSETSIPVKKNVPYQGIIDQMCATHIQAKERDRFVECTDLAGLRCRLEQTGQYSFIIHNVNHDVERYIYYWFDKSDSQIMFVIDDMTREMQIDSQTGLLNRDGFLNRTGTILMRNPENRYAILYFNIMRFKAINDLFGYEMGDRILKKSVEVLQNSFLKPVIIARMETDHFVALVREEQLDLKRMMEVLRFTYGEKETHINVQCHCGIYYIPADTGIKVSEMCDRAKLAKNYISNQYVQPYAIYQDSMKQDYEEECLVMINLDQAMERHEFQVYYQPIYEAKTGKIAAAEALVRWIPEPGRMVSPGRFIPILEKSGHITRLDFFAAEQVLTFQRERYHAGKAVYPVSVNLSRMDLMDEHIIQMIRKNILQTDLPADMVRYEVTESAYTDITKMGSHFLEEMREQGAKILIDDFGSGTSSFSTMRDYSFNVVKLDMGFIQSIGKGRKEDNMVLSIIEMAHRMDMKVVAEGVETAEQLAFLRACDCDYIQGYYFSKPLPQKEYARVLDEE